MSNQYSFAQSDILIMSGCVWRLRNMRWLIFLMQLEKPSEFVLDWEANTIWCMLGSWWSQICHMLPSCRRRQIYFLVEGYFSTRQNYFERWNNHMMKFTRAWCPLVLSRLSFPTGWGHQTQEYGICKFNSLCVWRLLLTASSVVLICHCQLRYWLLLEKCDLSTIYSPLVGNTPFNWIQPKIFSTTIIKQMPLFFFSITVVRNFC